MSRIGLKPIEIPNGVEVKITEDNLCTVKGPKGELVEQMPKEMIIKVEDNTITVSRPSDIKRHKSLHGLTRTLVEVPEQHTLVISGINKQQVGNYAAKIRDLRGPEPYKGKGIRYEDEHIRRKVGKTGK